MNRLESIPRAAAIAWASATFVFAQPSAANGRFPAAQHLVFASPSDASLLALRTTFGVLLSRDGGHTFRWLCESSLGVAGDYDPPIEFDGRAGLLTGLTDGATRTEDGCSVIRNTMLEGQWIADFTRSPDGTIVYAVETGSGDPAALWSSTDSGAHFARTGATADGVTFLTIDVAPSDPTRVYGSAVNAAGRTLLFRSNDSGATWNTTAADLTGLGDVYIAAIDPTDADRLWLRANADGRTRVLRSDDAATSVVSIYAADGPLLGFAVREDGAKIWIGGPDEGLLEAEGGTDAFHSVSSLHVQCLRRHGGTLYICTDWLRDGFALAQWPDSDASPSELFRFEDLAGPVECSAPSTAQQACVAAWPAQRAMLLPPTPTDAGTIDVARPMPVDAGLDASHDAGRTTPNASCGCAVPGRTGSGWRDRACAWIAAALLWRVFHRHRRRKGAVQNVSSRYTRARSVLADRPADRATKESSLK